MRNIKIEIITNGGYRGILDTDTGIVAWNGETPEKSVDVGYIHLSKERYSSEEIEAIKDFNIRYFANHSILRSKTPMNTSGAVARDWKPGEKERRLKQLREAKVVSEPDDTGFWFLHLFSEGRFFFGEEQKAQALAQLEAQQQTTEYRDDLPTYDLSLGGSFQRYFLNNSWLKEAERLKGSTIFIT